MTPNLSLMKKSSFLPQGSKKLTREQESVTLETVFFSSKDQAQCLTHRKLQKILAEQEESMNENIKNPAQEAVVFGVAPKLEGPILS